MRITANLYFAECAGVTRRSLPNQQEVRWAVRECLVPPGPRDFEPRRTEPAAFDITREQLPPGYIGHNIQFIHKIINERSSGSRTAAAATSRNQEDENPLINLPLAVTLDLASIYVFRVLPAIVYLPSVGCRKNSILITSFFHRLSIILWYFISNRRFK